MRENINTIAYILRHDPLLTWGLWLVAASLQLVIHIKHKLKDLGYQSIHPFPHPADWELATHYLEVRSNYGWSPWPVYLMWPCLVVGVVTLLIGLFR
jgi:hypothetical protein